jgi:predicted nucleic-acid-binding protein
MRALDTNVLIRLITRDDLGQAISAEMFIQQGAWVSLLALAETAWVLDTNYQLKPTQIATAIGMLLDHKDLSLQDSNIAAAALALFRTKPTLSFSDCLMLELARKAGDLPLGSFDRALSRLDGTHRL